jgi:hypothetical protein
MPDSAPFLMPSVFVGAWHERPGAGLMATASLLAVKTALLRPVMKAAFAPHAGLKPWVWEFVFAQFLQRISIWFVVSYNTTCAVNEGVPL